MTAPITALLGLVSGVVVMLAAARSDFARLKDNPDRCIDASR